MYISCQNWRALYNIVLTDPAGLLGPYDHVSAPEVGAVVAAAGDVEEAGQRRAREPDSSAVQETAQRGAQRRHHLGVGDF